MQVNDAFGDSLDQQRISAHPAALQGNKKLMADDLEISADGLKNKFMSSLQKLTDQSTQQTGVRQIQQLVQNFRNQDSLRIYLSTLKSLNKKPSTSSTAMEAQLVVISYICKMYRENLVDPSDKPPSLLKTSFRVIELIHSYFVDSSEGVQQSAAKSIIDVQKFVLSNQTPQHQVSLLFSPLVSMISTGIERSYQSAAALSINRLIGYWKTSSQPSLIKRVQLDLLQVFMKANPELYELLGALAICLQISGVNFMDQKLHGFISKLLSFLQQPSNQPGLYPSKVMACKVLGQLAPFLKGHVNLSALKPLQTLGELEKVSRSRLILIQSAAITACKAWRVLLNLQESSLGQKSSTSPLRTLKQMRQKHRQSKSKERSDQKKKETRIKLQQEIDFMKKNLEDSVKGKTWGDSSKGQNFVKKGTGIGGGQTGKYVSTTDNKGKSYESQIKQIKKMIEQDPKQSMKDVNKNLSPSNEKTPKDLRVELSKPGYKIKPQPRRQQNRPIESERNSLQYGQFTLQPSYGDQSLVKQLDRELKESLSFQISKSNQSPLPKFPQPNQEDKHLGSNLFSKQQLQNIVQSQAFSDMSSNLDGLLSSQDFANPSQLDLIDSNLNQSADIELMNQNKKKRSTLRNTAEKFMKRSAADMRSQSQLSISSSAVGKQVEESIQFELSKIRESQNKTHNVVKKQDTTKMNQTSKFDTLKPYDKYSESMDQEVLSEYQQSYQPEPKVNKEPRPEPASRQEPKREQAPEPEPELKPSIKKVTEEPPKKLVQTKEQDPQAPIQEVTKNYQNIIQRPPSSAQAFFPANLQKSFSRAPSKMSEQQKPNDEGLLQEWNQILFLAQHDRVEEAYERCFQLDDFLYFLRLVIMTGPSFETLNASMAKRVMNKVSQIYASNFFEILIVGVFSQASQLSLVSRSLNIEEISTLQRHLYDLSGRSVGKLSYSSAVLYNQIDQELKQ